MATQTTPPVAPATARDYQVAAEALVASAAKDGYVITIEQVPQKPLAMGNYRTEVSVRRARNAAA